MLNRDTDHPLHGGSRTASDRIAIMVSGKLRAVGTLSELEALTGEKGLENAFIKIAEAREGGVNA